MKKQAYAISAPTPVMKDTTAGTPFLDANLNTMGANVNEMNNILYRLTGSIDRIVGAEPEDAKAQGLEATPQTYIDRFADLNERAWRISEALNYQLNRLDKIS